MISRAFENFLADWVMEDITDVIASRQFGNMKRCSINHDFNKYIHKGLDKSSYDANFCAVDFCKTFGHINHMTAVEKMIQLGVNRAIVPTICSFLSLHSLFGTIMLLPIHLNTLLWSTTGHKT